MARASLPRFTDRLSLAASGLAVSPFCVGMVQRPETILAAFDAGINFFFLTADMHWPYYRHVRDGIQLLLKRGGDIRTRFVVACVSYVTQQEFCSMPFHEVLDNVPGLERLDILCAGGAYGHELDRRLPVYVSHRETRFVGARGIGVTFHDRAAAVRHVQDGTFDLCFIRYNAAHAGARTDLFPRIVNPKALLYNFKNLGGYVTPERCAELGLAPSDWRPKITDHYRFVLSQPALDGILCAPATPDHVDALSRAIEEGPLDEDEEEYLMDLCLLDQGKVELAR